MRTRYKHIVQRWRASALLLAVLAGCDAGPTAAPAQPVVRAHDSLSRPQAFQQALAELQARPEFHGQAPKAFRYVFFYDDGTLMLKLQNPRDPGRLDHYEYRPATSERPAAWDGPHLFEQGEDPAQLAPQLIRLDALPLQALPVADAALDRQIDALKARHPANREDLEQADSDRSIYFVVGGSDGAQRWESTLNALHAWEMSAYRFTFHRDGAFDAVEEMPDPARGATR